MGLLDAVSPNGGVARRRARLGRATSRSAPRAVAEMKALVRAVRPEIDARARTLRHDVVRSGARGGDGRLLREAPGELDTLSSLDERGMRAKIA